MRSRKRLWNMEYQGPCSYFARARGSGEERMGNNGGYGMGAEMGTDLQTTTDCQLGVHLASSLV